MGGEPDRQGGGAAEAEAGRGGCEAHPQRIAYDDPEGNVRDARLHVNEPGALPEPVLAGKVMLRGPDAQVALGDVA